MELLILALSAVFVSGAYQSTPGYVEPILSQSQVTGDQGEYQYSYKSGVESKSESRHPDGRTHGSYSYVDPSGQLQHVKYTAGIEGFQVEGTNLPQPPTPLAAHHQPVLAPAYHHQHYPQTAEFGETPEVLNARQQHAAAHAAALKSLPRLSPQSIHHTSIHPEQAVAHFDHEGALVDTPEVAAARSQHAAAYAAALRNLPKLREEPVGHPTPVFPSVHHVSPVSYHGGKFAEEIPRSALGETPEVAAAREAHLAYYSKVRADLPQEKYDDGEYHF